MEEIVYEETNGHITCVSLMLRHLDRLGRNFSKQNIQNKSEGSKTDLEFSDIAQVFIVHPTARGSLPISP